MKEGFFKDTFPKRASTNFMRTLDFYNYMWCCVCCYAGPKTIIGYSEYGFGQVLIIEVLGHSGFVGAESARLSPQPLTEEVACSTPRPRRFFRVLPQHRSACKDEMNSKIGSIYHILLQSQYGIWTINPFKGHFVLKAGL